MDHQSVLARYREPSLRKTIQQLLTTLVPLFALWTLMWFALDYSVWLVLLLAVPAAGFLMRVFIIHHDCGHGSLFKSKEANDLVGIFLSILIMTPYYSWRKLHSRHHATSGDLDRRGDGDIETLTVEEYLNLTPLKRLGYRAYRNPLVLFGIGPIFFFMVLQRFNFGIPASWHKERLSTYFTNGVLALVVVGLSGLLGFWNLVLIYLPSAVLGASLGVWLFYVQHQFEDAYWQPNAKWDYFKAGFEGSSYYDLPPVFQWLTANIGIHHLHHVDYHIPNYRLQECLNENPELKAVNRITFWQSLACIRLKLWDETQGKMVTFRDIKQRLRETQQKVETQQPELQLKG